jgi:hypothetical protein
METKEDPRYYVECPKRSDQARISVVKCFSCEFVTGSGKAVVEIGCSFPDMTKPWRRKGSRRPRVNKISRDGLS